MTKIGKNIMRRRKEIGMTQEELAAKMGYKSKSSINKIELGKSDMPQSKIEQFAKALETTPGDLMGWETVQKNNDAIVDIVVRLRNDSVFLELVDTLNRMDEEKILSVKNMLSTLLK